MGNRQLEEGVIRNRVLLIVNGSVILVVMALLFSHFRTVPGMAQAGVGLPGPAQNVGSAAHLAFVIYEAMGTANMKAVTVAQALGENGRVQTNQTPQPLFSQNEAFHCQTDAAHAAPNGQYLILQYNCKTDLFVRLLDLTDSTAQPAIFPHGYFLDWSPDGGYFLFRDTNANQVFLVAAASMARQPLDLPFGTYGASFAPDGHTVVYAASKGLGFGSEIGTLDLAGGSYVTVQTFPRQIVAYPRWSPNGGQMAYILMPDSNIPFTTGELWLADTAGEPAALLDASVDAGHGYPPVWSPDGQTISYIRRENIDSVAANHAAAALRSNVYQVDVAAAMANAVQQPEANNGLQATPVPSAPVPAGNAVQLTHFEDSLVYDMVWSPDGSQLAFTANDAIWVMDEGQEPVQASQPGIARHPVWLVTP